MRWDTENLGILPGLQRDKLTGVNGASVTCQTDQVNSWFLGEKLKSANLNPKGNPGQDIKALPNSQVLALLKCLQAVSLQT